MPARLSRSGFTIIEMLVVVSIIAVLSGILFPVIGHARDSARIGISRNNLRQMGVAHKTYAADWADRHVTYIPDNMGLYNGSVVEYCNTFGIPLDQGFQPDAPPPIIAGYGYSPVGYSPY